MTEAFIAGAFLVVAVVIGLLLPPLDAEVQAAAVKPAAESGHDDHGHHGH